MTDGKAKTRRIDSGRVIRAGSAALGVRSLRFIASGGCEVARDGLALNQRKWKLPRSGKCPLLNGHLDGQLGIAAIIGAADDFTVETVALESGNTDLALLARATFAESADGEFALQMYRAGMATSFSVSFIPNWDGASNRTTPASQELLEISCVAIPADSNAVVYARALRAQLKREPFTDREQRIIDRYLGLRAYGYSIEVIARDLFIDAIEVRRAVARYHAEQVV